jgi:hypothetical protein
MWDTAVSVRAINDWPTPVVFSGFAIGAAITVGARLKDTPEANPVRACYQHYNGLNLMLEAPRSGNPILQGWYADPEVAVFGDRYWIYPTCSAPYDQQLHFDAFSSPDLVRWTKHEQILDCRQVRWARRAMWAPAAVVPGRVQTRPAPHRLMRGQVSGIWIWSVERNSAVGLKLCS